MQPLGAGELDILNESEKGKHIWAHALIVSDSRIDGSDDPSVSRT